MSIFDRFKKSAPPALEPNDPLLSEEVGSEDQQFLEKLQSNPPKAVVEVAKQAEDARTRRLWVEMTRLWSDSDLKMGLEVLVAEASRRFDLKMVERARQMGRDLCAPAKPPRKPRKNKVRGHYVLPGLTR